MAVSLSKKAIEHAIRSCEAAEGIGADMHPIFWHDEKDVKVETRAESEDRGALAEIVKSRGWVDRDLGKRER